jgi:hypothetical protein
MSRFPTAGAAILALGLGLGFGLGVGVPIAGHAADDTAPRITPGGLQPSPMPGEEVQDQGVLKTVSAIILPGVEMSRLGAEKAGDPELQTLSQQMAKSYEELASELEETARQEGLDYQPKDDAYGAQMVRRLEGTNVQVGFVHDLHFDLTYLAEQSAWHDQMISIYTMEERAGENPALKKHAEEGRALLAGNLEQIQQIRDRLVEERRTISR